jgi:hypothetical protein
VPKSPRTIARLIASCVLAAALFLSIAIRRSAANPQEWNVDVTLAPLNTALFCAAVVLFWLSRRLRGGRGGAEDERR